MPKKISVSIIVDNDKIWLLPLLEKTIPFLIKNKLNIKSIIVCEHKLSKFKGFEISKYYFLTFGLWNFFKLSLYATIIYCKRKIFFFKKSQDFKDLSKKINCQNYICNSPNEEHIQKQLSISKIDIILIMSSHILNKKVINIPSIGIINKHASALPANKGLFPYFWAVKNNTLQGISYHKVNSNIDEGQLVFQKLHLPAEALKSMVCFYIYVFNTYPLYIIQAINNLIKKKYIKYNLNIQSSYFGLPTKKDYYYFKKKGNIINFSDIIYCIKNL